RMRVRRSISSKVTPRASRSLRRYSPNSFINGSPPGLLRVDRAAQYLPRLATLVRPDDSTQFQHVDQPGRPGVADAEAALQHGDRGGVVLHHKPNGVLVELIVSFVQLLAVLLGGHGPFAVHGLALGLPERGHLLHFLVADKR